MPLLDAVEKTFVTQAGDTRTYFLSKFPAVAGREIIAGYPLTGLPKIGDYKVNEEMMLKLMAHVGVPVEGRPDPLPLSTRALVDNHVPDWETLARIEMAMMEMNCSFFRDGRALSFFQGIAQQAKGWISETLTHLSAQSSSQAKQPSKNSKRSTP